MTTKVPDVEAALAQALGGPVRIERRSALSGGDISTTERIVTTAGTFVLKSSQSSRQSSAGIFAAEAAGLEALRSTATCLAVPHVIACATDGTSFLVLEDLGHGRLAAEGDEVIGRGLAQVHERTAPAFGFSQTTFCGSTSQPNDWSDSWIHFHGRARLEHQASLAAAAGLLSAADQRAIATLIARLDQWLSEPPEGPSLIHGDLWSGNLHVTAGGRPALIDPAVYFAHREAELGMMRLFGGFSDRVYQAYEEVSPLESGWRDRNDLYQIYHVLNHLNLFGRQYYAAALAIVHRYV